MELTGKVSFGFVAKYMKGATVPTGQTEFNFNVANLNFHSSSYEWLVIAGAKAMYKGTGKINNEGNYGFQLSAIDADLIPSNDEDRFRIRIWDKNNGNALVYDNKVNETDPNADPTTTISGGNIKIHNGKDQKVAKNIDMAESEKATLPTNLKLYQNYPNPFNPQTAICYELPEAGSVVLNIYNLTGTLVRTLINGRINAGYHSTIWDGRDDLGHQVAGGIYFYRFQSREFQQTMRMLLLK
jgi:hypothetical protein